MEEERFTWPSNLEGSLLLEDIVLRVMICGVGKDGLHARTGSLYPHLDRSDPGPGIACCQHCQRGQAVDPGRVVFRCL